MVKIYLQNADDTSDFGKQLASTLTTPLCCYLKGDLGFGKTALAKAIIQGFGINDNITSPTFTLMETYQTNEMDILHVDLYRIEKPEELELAGITEELQQDILSLIEWPDNGNGYIPEPDLTIQFKMHNEGRVLTITRNSEIGVQIIIKLQHDRFRKYSHAN